MTNGGSVPLSRPVLAARIPSGGYSVRVEATEAEREAVARALGLAALGRLDGEFRLAGDPERIRLTGRLRADITQVCVVTLEPFDSSLDETARMDFVAEADRREAEPGNEHETDLDAPDEIVDGRIDLGAVAVEILALALDPYPRKPGVAFTEGGDDTGSRPFDALAALVRKED